MIPDRLCCCPRWPPRPTPASNPSRCR